MEKNGSFDVGSPCTYCPKTATTVVQDKPVCKKCTCRANPHDKEASFKDDIANLAKSHGS